MENSSRVILTDFAPPGREFLTDVKTTNSCLSSWYNLCLTSLIAANPERVLWGTDWPHPDSSRVPGRRAIDIAPLLQIDDGRLFNQLPVWAPDVSVRRTILVENPARLYGF